MSRYGNHGMMSQVSLQFDPVNIGQHISLSSNKLTAAYSGAATYDLVRSTLSHSGSGKYYVEAVTHTPSGGAAQTNGVGLFTNATALHANTSNSVSDHGIVVLTSNGFVEINGSRPGPQLNSGGPFVDGALICFAIDVGNELFWARMGTSGQWNASGTANPPTGVGGVSFSGLTGPFYFGEIFGASEADSIVAAFEAASWAGAAPSGFGVWG